MFDALKLALIAAVTVPAALLVILLGFVDRHGKRVYRIARVWSWVVLKVGRISLKVEGLNRLDPGRQYIFIVNHQSNIDIPVLFQSLTGFQLRWIAKKELLWVPLFGWAIWASRHIIVDRADRLDAVRSLHRAKGLLRAGVSIVVFPEGTRSRDGYLLAFKKGGFLLASQTNTPVVPVTINGSGASLPVGAWRLTPATIEVQVGEPLSAESYRPGTLRVLSARVRRAIETHLYQPTNLNAEESHARQPIAHQAPRKKWSI